MIEHQFASEGLDYSALVDELRCHTTEWVRAERGRVVREQRALRVWELALTRVLDERGQIDDSLAQSDGVSVRDVRATIATARSLEDLPEIAAVAAAGGLSPEQLTHVARIATPSDDHEWATKAPSWSARDLAQHARTMRIPTIEDTAARHAARELRFWWRPDSGMLDGRFSLPDVDGAHFEAAINEVIERMRPAKGQPWETRERRGADALLELVHAYRERRTDDTTTVPGAHLIVQVPLHGPATVAGVPLPDEMVEALRASARVEPVLVDPDGEPIAVGRTEPVLSPKKKRVVLQRDGKCRMIGCDVRGPLDVHHLWPRSWGGSDDIANLAAVCRGGKGHHRMLAPNGPYLLLGNPNHPDGLVLVHHDDLPHLAQLAADRARAGTEAA